MNIAGYMVWGTAVAVGGWIAWFLYQPPSVK